MWNLFTRFFKYRHLVWLPVLCVALAGCKDDFDDSELRKQIADLDGRLTSLEKLCAQMNTNISSMQTIVNALQQNDYITGVTPITEGGNTTGYSITFAKNKPITIYHGKDGEKGETGNTPKFKIENGRWLVSLDGGKSWEDVGQATGNQGETGTPGISPKLKIENGRWLVSFDEGTTWKDLGQATGEKGENGNNGTTPVIGVKQDTDGIYYWTLNGTWLLDDNNQKVKAEGTDGASGDGGTPGTPGKDGITPLLKIEGGYWYVSYDNENSWKQLGKATGESEGNFFQEITEDDDYLYITLTGSQTIISIPKYKPLSIAFSLTGDLYVEPNNSYTISYTLTGADENTVVKALAQDGFHVVVKPTDKNSGNLEITTPATIINSEVIVFVSDNKGHIIMGSLYFMNGTIIIATSIYDVEDSGGQVNVKISTNTDYTVNIPEDAQSWISVVPQTKSGMHDEIISLSIQENSTGRYRHAIIEVREKDGDASETIQIRQRAGSIQYVHVEPGETLDLLLHPLDVNCIEKLTITGTLRGYNDPNYEFLKEMEKLSIVDLTQLSDTEIPDYAFFKSNIEEVLLPLNLESIPNSAFEGSSITSIQIPATVKDIGKRAFYGTSKLQGNIVIPDATVSIKEEAFCLCAFNGTLTLGKGVKSIGKNAFGSCLNATGDLIIPDNVTTLGEFAFLGCEFSGNLQIGNGIREIPSQCFFSSIPRIKGHLKIGDNVEIIGNSAFDRFYFTGDLIIPDQVKEIKQNAFSQAHFTGNLVMGSGVKEISFYAFNRSEFQGTLKIGENVTTIEKGAFKQCKFIGDLIIPDNVKLIKEEAFHSTNFTGNLQIGNGIENIPEKAFQNCNTQGRLIIGNGVKTIGNYAFDGCNFSGNLIIHDEITSIGTNAFSSTNFTGDLQIGNGIENIPEKAFQNCNTQGALIIGNGVKTIGNYAFYGSNFQGSFTMGKNVTSIGTSAFENCGCTQELIISENVTTIGTRAFANSKFTPKFYTSNIEGPTAWVIIPDQVVSIETEAFLNCSGLIAPPTTAIYSAITIGSSVKYIGDHAFTCYDKSSNQYLPLDKDVRVYCKPQEPPTLGNDVFGNQKLNKLYVSQISSVDTYKRTNWINYFWEIAY